MARYNQRPENAVKRANEFIGVGKPDRALDELYEVFRNKKWVYNWNESVLEPIMFKYLELCVELRKSHIAKEGLFQYRNMFQTVNVGSLENVIRFYLRTAEERTEAARQHSHQAVIDIDDLDNFTTPESILLSAVSGEGAQDRSDRTILTPWVKFLWESYCQCLELLRTNAHVETLYHDIAKMSYNFCLKYNRKTEFRKLCEKLRKHLEDIGKLPAQSVNVSLSKPETQQYNLETRLAQLDFAIQLELWQEAYKATEDIYNLMTMAKKLPVPKMMANYYQKLAMVFWKAGPNYYLYHAASLFKLFLLHRDMKKSAAQEELQKSTASRCVLAVLAVPLPSAHPEFDRFVDTDKGPLEKAQKLSILLSLNAPPTRASLAKDLVRHGVVASASPLLQELYNVLEVNFNPLNLCAKVDNIAKELTEWENYIPPLRDVTLITLVRQLSQVYETVTYPRLLQLAVFANKFHMEHLLVECVRQNDMQIRIDHSNDCIRFGRELSEAHREDALTGPVIQAMPSEQVRAQLINISSTLSKCLMAVYPDVRKKEHEEVHLKMVQQYRITEAHDHRRILGRRQLIENRKEELEKMNSAREMEEVKRAEEAARLAAYAEQKRMDNERIERERKVREAELQQIKDRTLKEKMQQISMTAHGQKILKTLQGEELKDLDAEKITMREAEELQKERKELQLKLKNVEKKLDYVERAKRIEETPLLKQAWEQKVIADRKFWNQQEAERISLLKQERKIAVEHRARLARMTADKEDFLNVIRSQREQVYEKRLAEFEKKLNAARAERLEQRRVKRVEDRKAKWEKAKQDELERQRLEEQRRRDEEERRLKEEEQKIINEKLAARREEERKRLEALERQAEIQRKREEEIESKLRERDAPRGIPPSRGSLDDRFRTSRDSGPLNQSGGGAQAWRRSTDVPSGPPPVRKTESSDSWRKPVDDVKPEGKFVPSVVRREMEPSHDEKPAPYRPFRRDEDERPASEARRDERPPTFRDDRPTLDRSRDERPSAFDRNRDERPSAFDRSRDERPSAFDRNRDERPSAFDRTRDERPSAFDRSRDERPSAFDRSRDERPSAFDRSRDERPSAFSSTFGRRDDRPQVFAKKDEERGGGAGGWRTSGSGGGGSDDRRQLPPMRRSMGPEDKEKSWRRDGPQRSAQEPPPKR